jgi:iron complex outermembrane receptor protein
MQVSARRLAPLITGMLWALANLSADGPKVARDLADASLEDLMNIEVTTVSKKEQKLSQAAAAVYVITQEDIRRSGMTAIPDLLRMVPGLQVGQMQGGAWGVSARGFNSQASDKMLVLVDGRSIYSPVEKGVAWDEQDILLEDIERIEVVRGPGATLWGANAVNGVVNIITKTAKDTQGSLVMASEGQGQLGAGLRFGGTLGSSGYYRVFSKYSDGEDLRSGQLTDDGTRSLHSGFRADVALSAKDSLMVEGDLFHVISGSAYDVLQLTPPYSSIVQGANRGDGGAAMVNWPEVQSARSRTQLRIYFDRDQRSSVLQSQNHSTIDADFQHEFALTESHDLVWGLGFRNSTINSSEGFNIGSIPAHHNEQLFSAFVQDQWKVWGDHMSLILGSKFEHNSYSGYNIQPSARLIWMPDARHSAWLAVSRAVRTPSYTDESIRLNLEVLPTTPAGLPAVVTVSGSPLARPETVLAYELGYRLQAARRVSLDIATFYNRYRHLQTAEQQAPFLSVNPLPPHLVIPLVLANGIHGEGWGGEISSNLNVTSHWRLIPGYSYLRLDLHDDPTSNDTEALALAAESPRHQFQLRSNLDLSRRLQFDAGVYYNDALPGYNIPAYTRLDARLGYQLRSNIDVSLIGRNLQGGEHQELISLGPYVPAAVGRSVFAKVTWGF